MRITKARLANRFTTAAKLMGWDTGPTYELNADGKGYRAMIGRTFLEHNSVYGWSVNQICNDAGGETRLKESCSAAAMDEWLGGVIFAAARLTRKDKP
jgi:hypothetical protein